MKTLLCFLACLASDANQCRNIQPVIEPDPRPLPTMELLTMFAPGSKLTIDGTEYEIRGPVSCKTD